MNEKDESHLNFTIDQDDTMNSSALDTPFSESGNQSQKHSIKRQEESTKNIEVQGRKETNSIAIESDLTTLQDIKPGESIESYHAGMDKSMRVSSYLVPGKVFHVTPYRSQAEHLPVQQLEECYSGGVGDQLYSIKFVEAEEICEIRMTDTLFLDHLPWRLASALKHIASDPLDKIIDTSAASMDCHTAAHSVVEMDNP